MKIRVMLAAIVVAVSTMGASSECGTSTDQKPNPSITVKAPKKKKRPKPGITGLCKKENKPAACKTR